MSPEQRFLILSSPFKRAGAALTGGIEKLREASRKPRLDVVGSTLGRVAAVVCGGAQTEGGVCAQIRKQARIRASYFPQKTTCCAVLRTLLTPVADAARAHPFP